MGQQQSKDELLYEKAIDGNIEAVKSLCTEGAGLEWIDKEGKTPLVVACMSPPGYYMAKTLIELGANVNAYRPGRHAGTPLHHAAKRGLDHTVRLLLSHGATPIVRNDDCQTPLDVARSRGFTNVVRALESHICYFSGWLREFHGPGFLEALVPQLLSRKIWVAIIPCGPHNPLKPLKLELVIYSTLQDAQPRTVVALWRADIEEPKFHQPDPTLIIFDNSTRTRHKFASANEGDRQQIQLLFNACRGIPQVMPPPVVQGIQSPPPTIDSQIDAEAAELAMGINASIQSAMEERLLHPSNQPPASSSGGWMDEPTKEEYNGWGVPRPRPASNLTESSKENRLLARPNNDLSSGSANGWDDTTNDTGQTGCGPLVESSSCLGSTDEPNKEEGYNRWGPSGSSVQSTHGYHNIPAPLQSSDAIPVLVSSAPSAPPEEVLDASPIQYPSIDFSPVGLSSIPKTSEVKDGDGSSSSCVICWEAPVEGACVPCGHMAGCMACLNAMKTKRGDCPVCRARIDQVIRLYAV